MNMTKLRHNRATAGFTVIELMVVIIILLILGALIALTYSGVQAKNRNSARQNAINITQAQLEAYYASTNKYPTLAELSNAAWRTANLKHLPADAIQDPHWNKSVKSCTKDGKVIAASQPSANCISYQVTSSDGSACDNVKTMCAHYTLVAILEGGEKYVKSSLN
jgi:prepilin-type N-terminal cleavage/methylation domain-containing protein